jgi:hypothetical protein
MTFDAKTGKHKIYVLANVGSEDAAKEYHLKKRAEKANTP